MNGTDEAPTDLENTNKTKNPTLLTSVGMEKVKWDDGWVGEERGSSRGDVGADAKRLLPWEI